MPIGAIVGGEIGAQKAKGDYARSEALREEALKQFRELYAPSIDEQKLNYGNYSYGGDFEPEREGLVELGNTEMDGISLDPATRDAQMAALEQLIGYSQNPEATAMDRAQMAGVLSEANRSARGQRDAVMQNMKQRGLAGSGMELVAQMQANQAASDQANQQGMNLAATAQQRALDALYGSANLGGQIRSQDYDQKKDRAKAQDAINAFNAQNRQGVMSRNTGINNQASLRNLDSRQQINNSNNDLKNSEQAHNKGLYQVKFGNDMSKAQGTADQLNNQADYRQNKADATQAKYAGYGKAADDTAKTFMTYGMAK